MSTGSAAAPPARTLHATLEGHKGAVHVARYAKGAARYVMSGGQDRAVRLWNPALGTEVKAYTSHGYEVLCLCVYVHCRRTLRWLMAHAGRTTTPSSRRAGATAPCSCGMSRRARRPADYQAISAR
jgi:hypothetical protein